MKSQTPSPVSLDGTTSLVTGAGSGIGRAIALAIAQEGGAVILTGRRVDALEGTRSKIEAQGRVGIACATDLTDDAQVDRLVSTVSSSCGGLAALVHAAGTYSAGSVEETTLSDLDELYECNVRAPFLLTRRLLPLLRAGAGSVVFVNSSAGLSARERVGGYSASKAALRSVADALRQEVNTDGIRVLSVFPGRTATPLQEAIARAEGTGYEPDALLQPEDIAQTVLCALLIPRTAEITDIHIRPARPF